MEKKLAKPTTTINKEAKSERAGSMTAKSSAKRASLEHSADAMEKKREMARKQAQEKMRSRTLAKQQQMAERISTATEQLAAGIEEASAASRELGATMTQIAAGAVQASSAAEESRAAVNQIDKASIIAMERAKESLDKMNEAQALIRSTAKDTEQLILGIREAAKTNLESVKLINELEKQSDEIGNIVQAVVRIADQTNLLALNAAIEAARAGEHGRGFAVVADEVRNLAEISEKSARNITELVSEIQKKC